MTRKSASTPKRHTRPRRPRTLGGSSGSCRQGGTSSAIGSGGGDRRHSRVKTPSFRASVMTDRPKEVPGAEYLVPGQNNNRRSVSDWVLVLGTAYFFQPALSIVA